MAKLLLITLNSVERMICQTHKRVVVTADVIRDARAPTFVKVIPYV